MGLTASVSGNHSIRIQNDQYMWITPSGVPLYDLQDKDLVKVYFESGDKKTAVDGKLKPSIEWHMQASIYKKLGKAVNAIVHTHSPYTLGIVMSAAHADNDMFQKHVIEEAQKVVGNPVIIPNMPSGSIESANRVCEAFEGEVRVVGRRKAITTFTVQGL